MAPALHPPLPQQSTRDQRGSAMTQTLSTNVRECAIPKASPLGRTTRAGPEIDYHRAMYGAANNKPQRD